MNHPNPSSFPQPQLQTPIPTMLYYAQPSFQPPPEISPPQIHVFNQPPVTLPPQAPAPVSLPPVTLPPQTPAPVTLPAQTPAPVSLPPQTPAPVALHAQTPAPVNSSQQPEQQMQKNRLQELTHKLNVPLPIYQTVNEGFQHAPKFRSTVLVDGVKFTSEKTFWTRKAAEKDVAELAVKHISQKKKDEEFPQGFLQDFSLIQEDTVFCKSILNEFATKMNMGMPAYNTIKPEGLLPVFVSSLVFNGVSYTGSAGKNKKEAEQLAARAVILSHIGNSVMGKVLCNIIKSKVKLYAALHKVNNPASTATLPMNSTQSSEVVDGKNVGVDVAVNHAVPIGTAQPKHDFKILKPESSTEATNLPSPASQATNLPIEFVHPSSELWLNAGSSSSKKRRKNKKKANKRLCTEQLPMPDLPLNQAPPCSVAQ